MNTPRDRLLDNVRALLRLVDEADDDLYLPASVACAIDELRGVVFTPADDIEPLQDFKGAFERAAEVLRFYRGKQDPDARVLQTLADAITISPHGTEP